MHLANTLARSRCSSGAKRREVNVELPRNGNRIDPKHILRHRTDVIDAAGHQALESITLADRTRGVVEDIPASALFVMIGGEPHTEWLPDDIARDEQGYIITGRALLGQPEVEWNHRREPLTLETSMSGVFAAGDVRRDSMKRVASAVWATA